MRRPRPLPWPWIAAVLAALLVGALAWTCRAGRAQVVPPTAAVPAARDRATPTRRRDARGHVGCRTCQRRRDQCAERRPPRRPSGPREALGHRRRTAPPRAASVPAKAEPAASAAGGRVYAQAELPPDIRRQLPPLAIGGSMQLENPANSYC